MQARRAAVLDQAGLVSIGKRSEAQRSSAWKRRNIIEWTGRNSILGTYFRYFNAATLRVSVRLLAGDLAGVEAVQ
jgi:hypothetical protein